tara:strand:- start:226 stop:711 length:486 start_codon:yes stop_codon:yes gene_type:complete
MIIECINCNKKFEVNASLIPNTGRYIQCGSCNHKWFYQPSKDNEFEKNSSFQEIVEKLDDSNKSKSFIDQKYDNFENTKALEQYKNDQIQNKKKTHKISKFGLKKFLSILIVAIISFIALIIILDTFKNLLIEFFPELELILFNLFETLKDIFLFLKNLFT